MGITTFALLMRNKALLQVAGSDEAAPSNSRTTKLLVGEKTHPEEPNKAHKEPKPVWAGQVIERKERERNKHGHCPGKEQEAVEFAAHLPP
jgi:hypothetical protein